MHALAGKPAPKSILPDIPALVSAYYTVQPDPADPRCAVSFGTSGHRGTSRNGSFNEDHNLAIVQAICLHRQQAGITGPLYLGKDTHALSEPAQITALEVLAANGVETMVAKDGAFTPTPSISHAILAWNKGSGPGRRASSTTPPAAVPPIRMSPTGWRPRPTNSCATATGG
jgi:phosphoglucomutase